MSSRGFIAVDRGLFDHPMFAPEPYTEREAWLWLIAEAAWKPTTVRVGKAVVKLGRGELSYSLRFMATKWRWSEPRVRRFLDRLTGRRTGDALIVVQATRDSTHLTICNYDRYQDPRRSSDAPSDAPPDAEPTQRRTTNQEPPKEVTQTSSAPAAAAVADIIAKPLFSACFTVDEPEVLPESDTDRLWRVGVPILIATSDRPVSALRSIVGKWIRDAGNDAAAVLRAIQRSQDEHAVEPIAFVNRIVNPRNEHAARHFGSARTAPRSGTSHLTAALAEVVERDARDREAGGVPQGFLTFDGSTH